MSCCEGKAQIDVLWEDEERRQIPKFEKDMCVLLDHVQAFMFDDDGRFDEFLCSFAATANIRGLNNLWVHHHDRGSTPWDDVMRDLDELNRTEKIDGLMNEIHDRELEVKNLRLQVEIEECKKTLNAQKASSSS